MGPRVALLGLYHETNTFSPEPAELGSFTISRGAEIVERYATAHATISGFLATCEARRAELIPLLHAERNPCGRIRAATARALLTEIGTALSHAGPFDAVLVAAHGAAAAEGLDDVDSTLVQQVRAIVGPDVRIGVALDLHANLGLALIDAADVVVGYRTNPHEDAAVRGARCAELTLDALDTASTVAMTRVPLVVNVLAGQTGAPPLRDLLLEVDAMVAREEVLDVTVFHGFPYADVPEMGASVVVLANTAAQATRVAARVARRMWRVREGLRGAALPPAEAVRSAQELGRPGRPAVLLDVGDNIGGGAPGDSTVLLAEALAVGLTDLVCPLVQPDAVALADRIGEGGSATFDLRGRTAMSVGPHLSVTATVQRLHAGTYEDESVTHGGFRHFDGGRTAVLQLERGPRVIALSRQLQSTSLVQLRAAGIDPSDATAIIAKGVVAPRAAYRRVTDTFVLAGTPGVTTGDLGALNYRRRPRPLFPFEASDVG